MALHEQCIGASDEWYTPPHVFDALDTSFTMDVASPGAAIVPWIPAGHHITCDGLSCEWQGFVWMNPPFGGRNSLSPWLAKFFEHGDGIALVPDRTSAPWWQAFAPRADLALFARRKWKFLDGRTGLPGNSPAQGTVLLAVGAEAIGSLHRAAARGLGSLFRPIDPEEIPDHVR
jgi:hypothetical protein